jgi:hypothetical protein
MLKLLDHPEAIMTPPRFSALRVLILADQPLKERYQISVRILN